MHIPYRHNLALCGKLHIKYKHVSFVGMKTTTEKPFKLYLSLSILAGTVGMMLGAGLVTPAEATTAQPACSDVASQVEPIQRAAEAIASDPRQTVDVLTSLVQSTVEQTVQCVTPTINSGTK